MVCGNVYLFGDSVARGIILDETGRYSPLKESFGALAAERLGINVVNKARFGCTITKGLDILSRFVGAERAQEGKAADGRVPDDREPEGRGLENRGREEPGLGQPAGKDGGFAILEFGGNDCDLLWNEVAASPEAEHLPATPLDAFSRKYRQMIGTLRGHGLKPALMSLPPLVAERYFDWVTRTGLDRAAILRWLGDVEQIFRWHEGYDKAVRAVAAEEGCPLLDVRKDFLATEDYRDYMCGDGIHPNREGHRLIEASLERYAALA